MLRLHAIQAEFGDCLLLEWADGNTRHWMLIDGGPGKIYPEHLQPVLKSTVTRGGHLEAVVLSHVDTDHAIGLLDLFADLRAQREAGRGEAVTIGALWHNTFQATIDPQNEITPRLKGMLASAQANGLSMANSEFTLNGIEHGNSLRLAALSLGVPLNPGVDGKTVQTGKAAPPLPGLAVTVLGPSPKQLARLEREWKQWLEDHEPGILTLAPGAEIKADTSVPNLSSLMFLAEAQNCRLLLTGDGLCSDLLEALEDAGLLDGNGKLHVDLLKLPHHGSARNTSEEFFQRVTAQRYLISANGRDGNPDLVTLEWLVKHAPRPFEIWLTNRVPWLSDLKRMYPPKKTGYTLKIMPKRWHKLTMEL